MADHTDGTAPRETPEPAAEYVIVDDTEDVAPDADADEPAEEPAARPLTAARVRQLSALRRGAYRARSYCVVAIVACAVAEGQLAMMTVRHVRALGWQWRPVGYVCGIVAAMMATAYFLRRAAELTRELRPSRDAAGAPGDQSTPDFSTLSDGSHAWKNLEQMREGS